jgi:hypothetical protein
MPLARLINARDLIYITVSPCRTRIIGGSANYLSDSDRFVVFHSVFPILRVSFSPFPLGELRSTLQRRGSRESTWQSALPAPRLGFPKGMNFSAAKTLQKAAFDDDNVVTIHLRAATQEAALLHPDPLDEAKFLFERLGELVIQYDDLADRIAGELGVRVSFVGPNSKST